MTRPWFDDLAVELDTDQATHIVDFDDIFQAYETGYGVRLQVWNRQRLRGSLSRVEALTPYQLKVRDLTANPVTNPVIFEGKFSREQLLDIVGELAAATPSEIATTEPLQTPDAKAAVKSAVNSEQ